MSEAVIRPAVPADASAIAQVRVDAWRSTYRGIIPDAYLAAMKIEESMALWDKVLAAPPNTTNTFVAEIDGTVVGFASGTMLAESELLVEQPFTWDGMDLVEVGYGWRELSALIASGGAPVALH